MTMSIGPGYAAEPSQLYTTTGAAAETTAGQLVQGPSGHVYGYVAPEGGLNPYLSDSELLAWVQTKSTEQYGQVRDAMDVSTERSKLIQDLTNLKSTIDGGASDEQINVELAALTQAYAGTQYADEIAALAHTEAPEGIVGGALHAAAATAGRAHAAGTLSEDIQAQVDRLGRDDQLALVRIQELMSNVRETAQLASNLMAGRNQVADLVIGNVK